MGKSYEVHSDYGGAQFENEHDAIQALWLLGAYHNIEINRDKVKYNLDENGYYEQFPLSIIGG